MEKIKIYSNPSAGGTAAQSGDGDAISLPEVVVNGSYPYDSWDDSWGSFSDPWAYPPSSMESSDGQENNSGGSGSGGSGSGGSSSGGSSSGTRPTEKPAGGGSGSGNSGGGQSSYSVEKATDYLVKHAYPSYDSKTCGHCAAAVRASLEAGGLSTAGHPEYAYQYMEFLPNLGFFTVDESAYTPQKGDIIVIDRIAGHPYGHIAMYSGEKWVSDFVQADMWGGSAYRNSNAYHQIFRKRM